MENVCLWPGMGHSITNTAQNRADPLELGGTYDSVRSHCDGTEDKSHCAADSAEGGANTVLQSLER
jgi:hypothetical protein